MEKSYYILLSVLVFLIVSPFFNGLFGYLFITLSSSHIHFNLEYFLFLVFLAYTVTLIPALCTGYLYGKLSLSRSKSVLRWLIPMLGCIIYLIYIFILQLLFMIFKTDGSYLLISFSLLSIGGSFISTVIANIYLRDKIA